jgi:hypothetical protein
MGLRDRAREALYGAMHTSDDSPASARRASQVASVLADTAADHHTTTAYVIAGLGAAAVAAEGALSVYVYPPGDYAGFDDQKGGRR